MRHIRAAIIDAYPTTVLALRVITRTRCRMASQVRGSHALPKLSKRSPAV
jgi:hypothetical protein